MDDPVNEQGRAGAVAMRAEPSPCRVRGCAWRGRCPDHDVDEPDIDPVLVPIMRQRPHAAGHKRQRSPARYETAYTVKSPVFVRSVGEPPPGVPAPVRRRRRASARTRT